MVHKTDQVCCLNFGLTTQLAPKFKHNPVKFVIDDRLGNNMSKFVGQIMIVEHIEVVL